MEIVSWNLNGLEDKNLDQRTEAAMFQMLLGAPIEQVILEGFKPKTPDIIVLQEVVARTFHAHIKPHLKAAGFHIYPEILGERSYFEVIASRENFKETHYQKFSWTSQGRGLSIAQLDNGLTIMTAHLESQKPGAAMRVDQAKEILALMQKNSPCIFAGDTNLRKEEWNSLEQGEVIDAWEALGSSKKFKTTWNNKKYKARYDRVWSKGVRLESFETFGQDEVAMINEPASDHCAVRVLFQFNGQDG